MRMAIHLDRDLLTEAERFALARGATLEAVVEEALRRLLSNREPRATRAGGELPTWGSGWLRPGVDLDKSVALLDLMDQDDAPV